MMRNNLLYLLSLFCCGTFAQKDLHCDYTYLSKGGISTEKCFDKNTFEGQCTAYDTEGVVIGKWPLSRTGLMSSVDFTFHDNGMVHKAHYSSHPDGGIQWYKSTTTYDQTGKKIDFVEQSHNDHLKIFGPTDPTLYQQKEKRDTQKIVEQEVMECAEIYVSELWLDNRTGKELIVQVIQKSTGDTLKVDLGKGDRKKVGEMIAAETYQDPLSQFEITILKKSGKIFKGIGTGKMLIDDSSIEQNRKLYVYDLQK